MHEDILGSWLSPDPAKDGLNWYQYCGSNPVTYVDPLGLFRTAGAADALEGRAGYYATLNDSKAYLPFKDSASLGKEIYNFTYELDKDEKFFISVVAAESIGEGELGWTVVANVIMNRVGQGEWAKYKTPREVMEAEWAFSCLNDGGSNQYHKAANYLENRIDDGNIYEQIIAVTMPIYHKEVVDITDGAQLYYSPKSMKPVGSVPNWANSYKPIFVPGINPNDFKLFSGERID